MSIIPGFGSPSIPPPPAPPPPPPDPPKRDDPSVLKARADLEASEKRRRGRSASILTSQKGVVGGSLDQTTADSNNNLG